MKKNTFQEVMIVAMFIALTFGAIGYVINLNKIDTTTATNAEAYRNCIEKNYHQSPEAVYQAMNKYPQCDDSNN